MGKTRKQEVRRQFRDAVFKRDGYRCVVCGFKSSPEQAEQDLDAHHITAREEMSGGGYVKENGVSLCDPAKRGAPAEDGCHWKAECKIASLPRDPEDYWYKFTRPELYKAIGSNYGKALQASMRLK